MDFTKALTPKEWDKLDGETLKGYLFFQKAISRLKDKDELLITSFLQLGESYLKEELLKIHKRVGYRKDLNLSDKQYYLELEEVLFNK